MFEAALTSPNQTHSTMINFYRTTLPDSFNEPSIRTSFDPTYLPNHEYRTSQRSSKCLEMKHLMPDNMFRLNQMALPAPVQSQ